MWRLPWNVHALCSWMSMRVSKWCMWTIHHLTLDYGCHLVLPGHCIFSCTRASQENSSWGSPLRCFLSLWQIGIPERDGATAGKRKSTQILHLAFKILIILILFLLTCCFAFLQWAGFYSRVHGDSFFFFFRSFLETTLSIPVLLWFWELVSWQKALITLLQLPL